MREREHGEGRDLFTWMKSERAKMDKIRDVKKTRRERGEIRIYGRQRQSRHDTVVRQEGSINNRSQETIKTPNIPLW